MFQGIFNRTIKPFLSSITTSSPSPTMSIKQTVDDAIAANKIVIFSKSYCPYCRKAKNLLATEFPDLKSQIYTKEYAPFSLTILFKS